MLVVGACVYEKLLVHLRTKRSLGEHTLDSVFNHSLGMLLEHLAETDLLESANILGLSVVDLLIQLMTGNLDLLGINDDHIVPAVCMGGIDGLVLAS